MRSKAYRASNVKDVEVGRWLSGRDGQAVDVGLDISKAQITGVLRWGERRFERPFKADNPAQIPLLVDLLRRLAVGRPLRVALEPTGTYGDPLRQALADAGLNAHRVSPKASHDYAEVFDGVPSQHDGKDACIVAELAAIGKSSPWPFRPASADAELAYWVDRLKTQRRTALLATGQLEGLLARHWPEASAVLGLRSAVLLRCLARYGGPKALAADGGALALIRRWGGPLLSAAKAEALLAAAPASLGVRQGEFEARQVREHAEEVLAARRRAGEGRRRLGELAAANEVISRQAAAVGAASASVLWVEVGDPREYDSGGAYRKAMGLNLKERSSGRWEGPVHISCRGSGEARRWLYFAALRLSRKEGVQPWYQAKKERDGGCGGRALVGLARKLALALYRVGVFGEAFEPRRLFAERRQEGGKRYNRQTQ